MGLKRRIDLFLLGRPRNSPITLTKGRLFYSAYPKALHATSFGFGWNLCRDDTDAFMVEAMFGPIERGDRIIFFPKHWRWEEIGVHLGLFESKGEAKKNGMSGPLPTGYNEKKLKKRGQVIFMYAPLE